MRIGIAGGVVLVLVLAAMVLGYSSLFTVYQTQQALVVRLGQPVRVVTEPGLNFKVPLIDSVIGIDKRILDLENPAQEVIASDQKRLVVDAFARYRIQDPLRFYQTVNTIQGANSQLSILLNAALRRVLGEATLTHVVRDERAQLMARVREQLDKEAQVYGISVVDVRIRRADLPEQNSQAVYQRMQTERQREAAEFRAQGSQKSQEIRSKADRDVTVLVAEATSKSEQVRGEGDGERNRIFAEAFGKDVDFFAFYRSMQAYEAGMRHNDTRMVLSPDSEFFRYFVDPSGKPRETAPAHGRPPPRRRPRRGSDPADQQTMTVGGNVRFSGRDRSGVRHRGDSVRGLSRAGEAGDGARHRDARQRAAADRHRVRRRRRGAGLAGPGLKRAGRAAFPPQSTGSVVVDQLLIGVSLLSAAPTTVPCVRFGVDALSNQQLFPGDLTAMARLLTVLAHAIRQPALSAVAAAALALPALSTPTLRARPGKHRRRRREGDRRGGQHLDLAEGRSARRRRWRRTAGDAAASAGLAVRGVLRGVLQEPPRSGRRRSGAEPHAAPRQFARLGLHHRRGRHRRSPTTTSSPTPTRSPSSSPTARG